MKYPIGIQDFKFLREGGFVYVDKTALVYDMVTRGKTYFLSRPRRFGKSILVSTLEYYFKGERELFKGLAIDGMEKNWEKHTVFHLDFNGLNFEKPDVLSSTLNDYLAKWENEYLVENSSDLDFGRRFCNILEQVHRQTGKSCVVLVDEYDKPLLDVMDSGLRMKDGNGNEVLIEDHNRGILKGFYSAFKAADAHLRFVLLTGVTKFSQVSVFSGFNQPKDISMDDNYEAICGISKAELLENLMQPVGELAEVYDMDTDKMVELLEEQYDGYHFSRRNMVDVFNPFSLINALADSDLKNYWASSGATSLLPKFVDDMELKLGNFDPCTILRQTIETSDVTGGGAELFLYQSGYLTIKDYQMGVYILGFPNSEVRQALYETVLPALTLRSNGDIQSTQSGMFLALQLGNLPEAMKCLKALIADVPYSNKKLASMNMEERYRLILSTIFNAIGCRVEVEKMIATGRIDMVVETTNFIYVLELKLSNNGGVDAATEQMKAKQYAEPFKADKRKVIALAIELDDMGKGLVDWKEV